MTNSHLASFVLEGADTTGQSVIIISDHRVITLYYYWASRHWYQYNLIHGNILVGYSNYIDFLSWIRHTVTSDDCIRAGFSEHEVMELFTND